MCAVGLSTFGLGTMAWFLYVSVPELVVVFTSWGKRAWHIFFFLKQFHDPWIMWWLPEIGLPPVIIHLHGVFHHKPAIWIRPFLETPMILKLSSCFAGLTGQDPESLGLVVQVIWGFGGFLKWRYPKMGASKWKIHENPIHMDDLDIFGLFWGHPHFRIF